MRNITEYIEESFLGKQSTLKFVYHVLELIEEMTNDKEKNFGIKFDEIGGNLGNNLWLHSKSLVALERNKYIEKSGNGYKVLLTTTSKENTISCRESVPVDIQIPDAKIMKAYSDDEIKDAIVKAADELKKKVKLY